VTCLAEDPLRLRVCSRAKLPAPYPAPLRPARGASSADSADSADSQRAGAQVLRGAEDGCFLLLALQSGRVEFTVRAHAGALLAAAVCDEGARYVTAAVDGCVKCWDPERFILQRTFKAPYPPPPPPVLSGHVSSLLPY